MTDTEPVSNNDKVSSSSSDDASSIIVWNKLKNWVEKTHDGHVHPALHLQAIDMSDRGVVACRPIARGELLIRLPIACALSGRTILEMSKFESAVKPKSSWMQCVVAYYYAMNHDKDNWKPYLDSLPKTYETLFQWSDTEIKTFLRGTTLGTMVMADRTSGSMTTQYQTAVRPVLAELGLLSSLEEDDEMAAFQSACMCISTRGFHYSSKDDQESSSIMSYPGPFLLPIIDLLNHNPAKKCTTLQYSDGFFCMIAERPIAQGEEIFHSYGDSLTSAQLLQTFGFVLESSCKNNNNQTPAVLSKSQHLIPACLEIKQSGIPKRLESKLANKEDEFWEVSHIPLRDDADILSDDILIDIKQGFLTDELVTWICLQFLPQEAYEELDSGLLDASILQDLYLGILVCRSLLLAVSKKLDEYEEKADCKKETCVCETTNQVVDRLRAMLEQPAPSTSTHRAQYGWTVRQEELSNLQAWALHVSSLMKSLYEDLNEDGTPEEAPKAKRTKIESSE